MRAPSTDEAPLPLAALLSAAKARVRGASRIEIARGVTWGTFRERSTPLRRGLLAPLGIVAQMSSSLVSGDSSSPPSEPELRALSLFSDSLSSTTIDGVWLRANDDDCERHDTAASAAAALA